MKKRILNHKRFFLILVAIGLSSGMLSISYAQVCSVGDRISPGESCTYPGTNSEFSVRTNGSGNFLFFTSGGGINARNVTVNGVRYNFAASKQADGTWLIKAAGDGSTPPAVSKPDLVVEQPTVSQSTLAPGASFTLSATVTNEGAGSAAATTLRYYRSTNTTISSSDTEVGTDSVGALDANQSGAESITLTSPASAGTYYYGACVEAVTGESSSNNNCSAAVSITVQRAPVVSEPSQSFIYWTDAGTNKIQRANLDGSNVQDLVTGLNSPSGIALDVVGSKMYWTDDNTTKIQRANLDGSNVQDLVTRGLHAPSGIALDVAGGKMYWTDQGTAKIQRANLDGSNVQDLVTQGLSGPNGIALDVVGGKMYWTDQGTHKIQRANLDGSNVQDLVTRRLDAPAGIALDVAGGKMYWTDYRTEKIQRANLDGSNVQDLVTQGLETPIGIALDMAGSKMYWVDHGEVGAGAQWGKERIQCANLDGSNVQTLVTRAQGLTFLWGIALGVSPQGGGTVPPPVQQPDLVVQQPTVSKSTLAPGERFTLSAIVKNQSAGSAAATTLRYYRSTDTTISSSDTEVGTDSVSALGANQSGAESITLAAPSSPGTYYYGACVEAVTGESSSNNNCSAAVSVTVRQTVASGSIGRITGTVSNADGTPVVGATVEAPGFGSVPVEVTTDENGVYTIPYISLTNTPIQVGDEIAVKVTDPAGNVIDRTHTVTAADSSAGEATFNITLVSTTLLSYTATLPIGISLFHVPLEVEGLNTVSDLKAMLGSSANLLITYDGRAWNSRSGNVPITSSLGILVSMGTETTVTFEGIPWSDGAISLKAGNNLIGLPLNDDRVTNVSDILRLFDAGVVTGVIVASGGKFNLVASAGAPGDGPVSGDAAYLVMASAAGTATVTGDGWSNRAIGAAPIALTGYTVDNQTPVLNVNGSVVDEITGVAQKGFRVKVKNLSTKAALNQITSVEAADGYNLTFVDLTNAHAARVGDVLEISADSANPRIGVKPGAAYRHH